MGKQLQCVRAFQTKCFELVVENLQFVMNFYGFMHSHCSSFIFFSCFTVSLFWCNQTYVGNKVGIYFSVSRGRCVSSQRPMPSWPAPLIKKPLLALVGLSKSPSPHLCVFLSACVHACLREHVGCIDITEIELKKKNRTCAQVAFVAVFIFTQSWSQICRKVGTHCSIFVREIASVHKYSCTVRLSASAHVQYVCLKKKKTGTWPLKYFSIAC